LDTNGIFYHLATDGHKETWKNPATNGQVIITASSIDTASSPVQSILDRQLTRFVSKTQTKQWIQVQLPVRKWSFYLKIYI
jgi:hypothetical protein